MTSILRRKNELRLAAVLIAFLSPVVSYAFLAPNVDPAADRVEQDAGRKEPQSVSPTMSAGAGSPAKGYLPYKSSARKRSSKTLAAVVSVYIIIWAVLLLYLLLLFRRQQKIERELKELALLIRSSEAEGKVSDGRNAEA